MPSMELFNKQSSSYQDKILGNKPKVIIEAASSFGWHKYVGKSDILISMIVLENQEKVMTFLIFLALIVII